MTGQRATRPTEVRELLGHVFDGKSHFLSPSLTTWLTASRRFADFVSTFRDKIRKKVRAIKDHAGSLDLRLELETAYLLLREKNLSVVYEPGQADRTRRPDFAVRFTTSVTFMVEATRLRADHGTFDERLTEAVYGKLGQLVPGRSNVLLIGVGDQRLTEADLRATMLGIQWRAERGEPLFLQRRGFRDRGDFFSHYQRLSELLVRGSQLRVQAPIVGWTNPQARDPLPARVRTALYRSQAI